MPVGVDFFDELSFEGRDVGSLTSAALALVWGFVGAFASCWSLEPQPDRGVADTDKAVTAEAKRRGRDVGISYLGVI